MRVLIAPQEVKGSLTAQQAENNIVRVAIQALAAVLGGTQSLHTNSMDETLALPTEKAVRIALRTQQILAHESGVANVIDPLGGSYFVESLTNTMEEQAEDYFRRIEELGGVVPAIEEGFFQREIGDASYRLQREYDEPNRFIVGLNRYMEDDDPTPDTLKITQEMEDEQIMRLKKLREDRSSADVDRAIDQVRKAAENGENLMPHLIEAVKAYTTLGEIVGVLKGVFGDYREAPII